MWCQNFTWTETLIILFVFSKNISHEYFTLGAYVHFKALSKIAIKNVKALSERKKKKIIILAQKNKFSFKIIEWSALANALSKTHSK